MDGAGDEPPKLYCMLWPPPPAFVPLLKILCLVVVSFVLHTTKRVVFVVPVGKRDGFANAKY